MKRVPIFLQDENSECALACLAMICAFHGRNYDLASARRQFPQSGKGATLQTLALSAHEMGFATRAVRLELTELRGLRLPCVAHWDLNHFVVLERVTNRGLTLVDPAKGRRTLTFATASAHFTGVALELVPTPAFVPSGPARDLSLQQVTGKVSGLRSELAKIFFVALALEVATIAAPIITQFAIDKALPSYDDELLKVIAYAALALLLCQVSFAAARSWLVMNLSHSLLMQWSSNIFFHLLRLPIGWFERRSLGDISSRFGVVNTLHHTIGANFVAAIIDGFMSLLALAIMFAYSPQLAVIPLSAIIIYTGLRTIFVYSQREAAMDRVVLAAKETTYFLEAIRAITAIKLFGRESHIVAKRANLFTQLQNREADAEKVSITAALAGQTVFGIESVAVTIGAIAMIIGSLESSAPAFTVGMLFAFLMIKGQFIARSTSLINFGFDYWLNKVNVNRLADIVQTRPEPSRTERGVMLAETLPPTIDVRNVAFRYSRHEPWILSDVTFSVADGEAVAIVGGSGCGKTTLIKLLLGVLEPSRGSILIGGVPLKELGPANARSLLGVVMQDDNLLTGTIAENIAFFDATTDRVRVEECASLAGIADEVRAMPMRYDTLIGDLGTGLSGGQKQRLLLARALYARPRILILDEASSHLDITREAEVNASLKQSKITRLIIAHRPNAIAAADRVIELRDGSTRLLEVGGMDLQRHLSANPDVASDVMESR